MSDEETPEEAGYVPPTQPDISAVDEALFIQRMMDDFKLNQKQVAERLDEHPRELPLADPQVVRPLDREARRFIPTGKAEGHRAPSRLARPGR